MKLETTRETLLEPVGKAAGVATAASTSPILGHVLLHSQNGRLWVTGTNIETELSARTDVECGDVAVTAPAKRLADVLKALPAECPVTLEVKGDKLAIRAGRSRFSLATLPADDFPIFDNAGESVSLHVPGQDLSDLLAFTQRAMAQQDVRYYLNGLLLDAKEGKLHAVGTDGHRLGAMSLELDSPSACSAIVPRRAVLELRKHLGEDVVALEFSRNAIALKTGSLCYTSKLIDGKYPDWRRVVPSGDCNTAKVNREELLGAVRRAAILADEKMHGLKLAVTGTELRVSAQNHQGEQADEQAVVEYDGPDFEIGANAKYLLDAIQAFESDDLLLELRGDTLPMALRDAADSEAVQIVMPMRI